MAEIIAAAFDGLPGVFCICPIFITPFVAGVVFLPAGSAAARDPAALLVVVIAVVQPAGIHGAVGAEMIPVAADLLVAGDHVALGGQIIVLPFVLEPAGLHDPFFVAVVPVAVELEPAGHHLAVLSEIVPFPSVFEPAVCQRPG